MSAIKVCFRVLALGLAAQVLAQQAAKPVVNSHLESVQATVQALDPATRQITLKGPKGSRSFVVGQEAKNLDKVHVGDTVVVSYYEGVAVQMAKDGAKASEPATSEFVTPNQGGKRPGGMAGESMTSTVTIEDVEPSTNTVAFRRSDGTVNIVAVRSPDMQKFAKTLKRGDTVEVTYTQSLAVDVKPAGSH